MAWSSGDEDPRAPTRRTSTSQACARAAHLVTDPVHHRLPEIGLKRALAPGLEAPDLPKRIEQGVLNKVVGVGRISRPLRQPAARPALEGPEISRKQRVERRSSRRRGRVRGAERSSRRPAKTRRPMGGGLGESGICQGQILRAAGVPCSVARALRYGGWTAQRRWRCGQGR